MFHPTDTPLARGWVGRVDGGRVLHLAAQTLQSFFLGGGRAREHAEYRLSEVTLLAPVLQPPTVRLFDAQDLFVFANATAVTGPGAIASTQALSLFPRVAAVIGADQQIGGFTALAEWRAAGVPAPKDRDFALGLGPVVVTPDEFDPRAVEFVVKARRGESQRLAAAAFDWERACAFAAAGTTLRPGDLLAGPSAGHAEGLAGAVDLEVAGVGVLRQEVG